MSAACSRCSVLVLGIGNILLRDESVGVRVIEQMQKMHLPDDVELVDGGTAGADLLDVLAERQKIIVIDAVQADCEPDLRNGKTLSRLCDETGKLTGLNDIRSTSYLPGLGTASRFQLAIIYRFQKSCMRRLPPQTRLKLPQNSRALPKW